MNTDTNNGLGILLVMVFVALLLVVIFLISRRKSKGMLGNRFLLYGAIVGLVVFFLAARGPMLAYYNQMVRVSPYDFSEFKSIVFQYGEDDSLLNQYNSATGVYQFLDRSNHVQKKTMFLTADDLLYLHRKAAELGFWDFPENEINKDTVNTNGIKPIIFSVEFNYQHKSKRVLFSSDFNGPKPLVEENRALIDQIQQVLKDAEERQETR